MKRKKDILGLDYTNFNKGEIVNVTIKEYVYLPIGTSGIEFKQGQKLSGTWEIRKGANGILTSDGIFIPEKHFTTEINTMEDKTGKGGNNNNAGIIKKENSIITWFKNEPTPSKILIVAGTFSSLYLIYTLIKKII